MGNLENKHPAFNENVMAIGHNLQIANSHHFNKLKLWRKKEEEISTNTTRETNLYGTNLTKYEEKTTLYRYRKFKFSSWY